MGKLAFTMDSRFHGNDANTIIVIPAKAGIHPIGFFLVRQSLSLTLLSLDPLLRDLRFE
jgi:hypothetical protein